MKDAQIQATDRNSWTGASTMIRINQRNRIRLYVVFAILLLLIVGSTFERGSANNATGIHGLKSTSEGITTSRPGSEPEFRNGTAVQQVDQPDTEDPKASDRAGNGLDQAEDDPIEYREIFSNATWNREYIPIFYQGANVINPSIIPHPTEYYFWVVIAEHVRSHDHDDVVEQISCTAVFYEGSLLCVTGFTVLPVTASIQGNCGREPMSLSSLHGPRNARVFYGPDAPYVLYGSQSQYGCIGMWLQDARSLLEPFYFENFVDPQMFKTATEVRRPRPPMPEERNFFLFWDNDGQAYVHYDVFPQRYFARLGTDGTVADDLAVEIEVADQKCMAKYMPQISNAHDSLQQATNSLSITLCNRVDPGCTPDDSNTFIVHIFHLNTTYAGHVVYEPFTVLFHRIAPFAIHAISQRPLWIHGRKTLNSSDHLDGSSERIYITSVNWKSHTQKYHGYLDDLLFLGIGIEDSHPGAMDVAAGDLLQDLAFC